MGPRIGTWASPLLNLLFQPLACCFGDLPACSGPESLHIVGPSSRLGRAGPACTWWGEEGKARQGTHGAGLWRPTEQQICLPPGSLLLDGEGGGVRVSATEDSEAPQAHFLTQLTYNTAGANAKAGNPTNAGANAKAGNTANTRA